MIDQRIKDNLEAIIYDHFPSNDEDFKKGVTSNYTMDELRESCLKTIIRIIEIECLKSKLRGLRIGQGMYMNKIVRKKFLETINSAIKQCEASIIFKEGTKYE